MRSAAAFTQPPGYGSTFEAYLDVMRFGPAVWGPRGFLVLIYHVERSQVTDQRSSAQAINGTYSYRDQAWIRGPVGVSRSTFARQNEVLEKAGVLKRERRFTKQGGAAPTEYELDWPAIRAAIDQWKTDHRGKEGCL